MAYDQPFKPNPDTGSFNANTKKTKDVQPDYWGEIRVNLKDMTAIKIEDGCHVIKLSGWKKLNKSGHTYLQLKVNRWTPDASAPEPQRQQFADDSDVPF